MEQKRIKLTLLVFWIFTVAVHAQYLDKITLSSGGESTNEISYVIGEVFNFSLAQGNFFLETGSQASTNITDGYHNPTQIEELPFLAKVNCYPNPASDNIYFNTKNDAFEDLLVLIYDNNGKLLIKNQNRYAEIMNCNIENLPVGQYFLSLQNKQGKVFGTAKFIKN